MDYEFFMKLDNGNILVKTDDIKPTFILTTIDDFMNDKVKEITVNDRVGLTYFNNKGELMTIVEYNSSSDIYIQFIDDHKAIIHTTFTNFKNGEIINPYRPSYYNKGYIGEGFKPSRGEKSMVCWRNMLKRSYNENYKYLHSTYNNCEVCDEWLNFQNFHIWYNENFYNFRDQTMCLDKDILYKNNKMYSPETTIFVPQFINKLFTKRTNDRGKYPIGVYKSDNCFIASCSFYDLNIGRTEAKKLGTFDNPIDAFYCYKVAKENYIKTVAMNIRNEIPEALFNAMMCYEVDIED